MYDLIIIGGSAVGSAAAIYAARRKLNVKVIAKDLGGEVALSGIVENWPGVISTTGIELAEQFSRHLKSYEVPLDEGFEVTKLESKNGRHQVTAKDSAGAERAYEAKAVIIGSGIHPRKLGVPGEDRLAHRGVTSCTVCDGPLFRNKVTATVGAGNSALESALMMKDIAHEVYLVTKFPESRENYGFPKGEPILADKLRAASNVNIIYEATTLEIVGDQRVSGLKIKNERGQEQILAVEGIMVHIGMTPNSQFAAEVKKNSLGEIEIDHLGRTSVPGVFAAGDVTNVPYKQIAIAAGHGVTSALSAIDYLNKLK